MTPFTVTVDEAGRVVPPREVLDGLGIRGPDQLTLTVEGGELRAMTREAAIRKAQALVAEVASQPGFSLSSEGLIAERRAEAARADER